MKFGVEIPTAYRAYLMEQLTDGTDPTALEKNLRSTMRFLLPWMKEKPRRKKKKQLALQQHQAAKIRNRLQGDTDSDGEYLPETEQDQQHGEQATAQYQIPTARRLRKIRQMIQPLAEALAACEAAWAPRSDDPLEHTLKWELGFDGSEINKISTPTANIRIPTKADPGRKDWKVVTIRGCYYCVGKTAKLETDAVMSFFENGRTLLSEWRALHEKMYPGDKHNIPDPWLFGVERVNKTISDTYNQSALMQTLVGEKIKQMIIERLGDEWDNMSEEDQQRATAVEKSGCIHHLRNLVIQWGAKSEVMRLKSELAEDLEDLPKFKRLEEDPDSLLRSLFKEFGKYYAKGKHQYFWPWVTKKYPDAVVLKPPRGDQGSRQDWSVDAAFIEYANRKYYVEFLETSQYDDGNILEDSIYVRLTSRLFVAALRARAIVQHKISAPFRFISNADKMAHIDHLGIAKYMDQLEKFLLKVVDDSDCTDFMDEDYKVFSGCEQLDEYFTDLETRTYYTNNGQKKEGFYLKLLGEMYDPIDETNDECSDYLEALLKEWAGGMLFGLQKNMSAYLTSKQGKYSESHQTDLMKEICKSTLKTNNELGETMFAYFDYRFRRHPNFLVSTVAGIVVASKNRVFAPDGIWHTRLSEKERSSLMRLVVSNCDTYMERNVKVKEAQDEHNRLRRDAIEDAALLHAKEAFAKRVRFWEMGQGELKMVTYPFKKVKAEYDNIAAVTTKNKFLRNQFSIRFHGYDWTEYQTAYSKDGELRADAEILKELEELMKRETRVPPTEPPVPELKRKTQPVIGGMTAQRKKFEESGSRYEEDIRTTYKDTPKKSSSSQGVVFEVPEMQDLINKRVWFKWDEPDGWCEGVVTKIADGKRKRKGCRKVLEYDWALLQYSDCREPYWQQLRPGWYGKDKRAAWKLA